jgi:hypothetical protein
MIDPQYDDYEGSLIEEIVNKLLDGDKSRVGDIESVNSEKGDIYVTVKRKQGKKLVEYIRKDGKKLVAMSPEEIKILENNENSPLSYSYSKNGNNSSEYSPLGSLLNVLSGNGYSVANVDVIKSVGFDIDTVLKITRARTVDEDLIYSNKFYIVKSNIVYAKTGK